MNLLDEFVEECFLVGALFADEDVGHALSDELEGLHVVFILVEVGDVVLEVDFRFSGVLLYLLEEEVDVFVGAFLDLRGDVDAGHVGPRDEEIAEELFEYILGNYRLFWWHYHFERDSSLKGIIVPPQDVHVLQKVLQADLKLSRKYPVVVVEVKRIEQSL